MVQLTSSSIDQGWAWFVMIGCFINIVTTMTFIRSTSIFFLVFLERFKKSATMTTLSFSLNTISFSIGSIIVPVFLLPRFSVRSITLVGATLVSVSIIGMAFAPSMLYIHVTFCALGFSHPLLFISQTTLMGAYFKKKLSFALAFANIGLSIATMVGPAFTQLLLDTYGLHGAILIHGGLNMQTIVACMLFWPAPLETSSVENGREEVVKLIKDDTGSKPANSEDANAEVVKNVSQSSLGVESKFFSKGEEEKRRKLLVVNSDSTKPFHGSLGLLTVDRRNTSRLRSHSECDKSINNISHSISHLDSNFNSSNQINSNRPNGFAKASILATDILNSLSVSNVSLQKLDPVRTVLDSRNTKESCGELAVVSCQEINQENLENSLQNEPKLLKDQHELDHEQKGKTCPDTENQKPNSSDDPPGTRKRSSHFFRSLRESTLTHPIAWLLILASGFGVNTQCGASYIPSLGKENGVQEHYLPYLMTAIGAGDLLKLLVGYVADKKIIQRIHITCLSQLIVGTLFQTAGLCQGLASMMTFSVIFGATTGIFHVLLPGITVDLLGARYIGPVMSGYFLVNGAVMSTCHVVVGLFKDNTGSFVGSYHFIGGLMLAGMVILLMEPLVRRAYSSRRTKSTDAVAKPDSDDVADWQPEEKVEMKT